MGDREMGERRELLNSCERGELVVGEVELGDAEQGGRERVDCPHLAKVKLDLVPGHELALLAHQSFHFRAERVSLLCSSSSLRDGLEGSGSGRETRGQELAHFH